MALALVFMKIPHIFLFIKSFNSFPSVFLLLLSITMPIMSWVFRFVNCLKLLKCTETKLLFDAPFKLCYGTNNDIMSPLEFCFHLESIWTKCQRKIITYFSCKFCLQLISSSTHQKTKNDDDEKKAHTFK